MHPFARLAAAALGALLIAATPALAGVDAQYRSDRVVGYWHDGAGTPITIAYTGAGDTVWIQVFEKGHNQPQTEYTARWTSDTTFTYRMRGLLMTATREGANRIRVRPAKGTATSIWRRDP